MQAPRVCSNALSNLSALSHMLSGSRSKDVNDRDSRTADSSEANSPRIARMTGLDNSARHHLPRVNDGSGPGATP